MTQSRFSIVCSVTMINSNLLCGPVKQTPVRVDVHYTYFSVLCRKHGPYDYTCQTAEAVYTTNNASLWLLSHLVLFLLTHTHTHTHQHKLKAWHKNRIPLWVHFRKCLPLGFKVRENTRPSSIFISFAVFVFINLNILDRLNAAVLIWSQVKKLIGWWRYSMMEEIYLTLYWLTISNAECVPPKGEDGIGRTRRKYIRFFCGHFITTILESVKYWTMRDCKTLFLGIHLAFYP